MKKKNTDLLNDIFLLRNTEKCDQIKKKSLLDLLAAALCFAYGSGAFSLITTAFAYEFGLPQHKMPLMVLYPCWREPKRGLTQAAAYPSGEHRSTRSVCRAEECQTLMLQNEALII